MTKQTRTNDRRRNAQGQLKYYFNNNDDITICHWSRYLFMRNNNIISMWTRGAAREKNTRTVTSDFARTSRRPQRRRRLRRLRLRPWYERYNDSDDRGGARLHDCGNLRKYDFGTSS